MCGSLGALLYAVNDLHDQISGLHAHETADLRADAALCAHERVTRTLEQALADAAGLRMTIPQISPRDCP